MASLITNQGLADSLNNSFGIGTADPVDAMGVSNFGSLAAGTTTIAAATSKKINAIATPTISSQTVTCVGVFTTGQGNFAITTITLHNDGADTSTGVYGGVDGQSITKTSDFSLTITLQITYATA